MTHHWESQIQAILDNSHLSRPYLSHRFCTATRVGTEPPEIVKPQKLTADMNANPKPSLPNLRVQAANLIRFVGDEVTKLAGSIPNVPINLQAVIGARDLREARKLLKQLIDNKIITVKKEDDASLRYTDLNLSLDGWDQYETEKHGRFAGDYGFLAMKYDDHELEDFVANVLKPAVKQGIGCELHDLRDRGRARIIDNIMRVAIRDCKFVIADLTHDNLGAYWESGYAEGLEKPVVYICKKEKF